MPPIPEAVTCSKCKKRKPRSYFHKNKATKTGLQWHCKTCMYIAFDKPKNDPKYRLWLSSYCRANTHNMEHTITINDIVIPNVCPYLGIPLDLRRASVRGARRSQNGASIDRIDNTKGYVPGNIQIISDLANRMKQEATLDQLVIFAENVLRRHKDNNDDGPIILSIKSA